MEETMLRCPEILPYPHQSSKLKQYMQSIVSNNNNHKCECCPYGHHVNVDFVEFAKDITDSHNELQKIRRCHRKLEKTQNAMLSNSEKPHLPVKISIVKENAKVEQSSLDLTLSNHIENTVSKTTIKDSPIIDHNLSNNEDNNKFLKRNSNESMGKYSLANSKSFVVSYEHLMSIREQMSTSLKRVQELETEVKHIYGLRQQLDGIRKENNDLNNQLMYQKEINDQMNSKDDLNRRINSLACSWTSTSEFPSQLLPNIERLLKIKLSTNSENFNCQVTKPNYNIKSTQTEYYSCKKSVIDSISSYEPKVQDLEVQTNLPYLPKVKRRNFGVTVRPIHHHFTQQITSNPIMKSVQPDEYVANFVEWLQTLDNELHQKYGFIFCNILSQFFTNSYQNCVEMFENELKALVDCKITKPTQDIINQTDSILYYDNFSQIEYQSFSQSTQTLSSNTNKTTETDKYIYSHQCTDTVPRICHEAFSQTQNKTCHNSISNEVNVDYKVEIVTKEVASSTESFLMDDLLSEKIENSMQLIHEELKAEISREKSITDCVVSSDDNSHAFNDICFNYDADNLNSHVSVVDSSNHYSLTYKSDGVVWSGLTNQSKLARSNIFSSSFLDYPNENECKVIRTNIQHNPPLKCESEMSNTEIQEVRLKESQAVGISESISNDYHFESGVIITEPLISTGQLTKSTTLEETSTIGKDKDSPVIMINSNRIKQDGDTDLSLPSHVEHACQLVTLWMNDSTTTYSKDLNESLAAIRCFWFEITQNNEINLQFYLDQFVKFNPILKEKIINMTDSNGNTCLHYAVSEGRWSIVRQVLETELADVNRSNKVGYTVLMLAAVSDTIHEVTLRQLIAESEVDKQSDNEIHQTALMIAASRGKTQLVQMLLEAGASVNKADSYGSTALMCACENGHMDVVQLLLARVDVDTESEDNTGSNALKICMDNGFKDIGLLIFAKNNLQKGSLRSKKRSGSSNPTSPLNQRKFK